MTVAAISPQPAAMTSNLTIAQQLLWQGQKQAPDFPLYNMAFLFTLTGEIKPVHFQAAFQALVQRSDALRMVIEDVDGVAQRRVLSELDYEVAVLDFSAHDDPQAAARVWAQRHSQTLFNLSERLFETALIRLGADCYTWYLNQNHVNKANQSVHHIYKILGNF